MVWASLYRVATTGAGLPGGPFGVVGAVEGLSYLLMVGLAGSTLFPSRRKRTTAQTLSVVTLAAGISTLLKLIGDRPRMCPQC